MILQRTLQNPIEISGIGLHSGANICLRLRPAAAGTGIIFYRRDAQRSAAIPAKVENVVDTRLATVLGRDGLTVSTVEHFLAALSACGIDNLHVDIDGPEVPILDGSAAPFIAAIEKAGTETLLASRKFIAIRKPISLIEGDKRISIIPSRFFRITFDIAFEHKAIAVQQYSMKFTSENFQRDIAPARTFGFLHEVEHLKSVGLARGGSLDNAVVIDEGGVINPEGLRYRDEFVRHKILDACGDFSLLGAPMLGHIRAFKAGHDLNAKMVRKILANPDHWATLEFDAITSQEAQRQNSPAFAVDLAWSKN
ncbi:MAG: UDP-3-O-acyl-N-acetylglucosamine deacetylase [Deltaproteobacteria bacterium]|nr:UDP-3-O-acyl-N-acetylglucosamine deacetylase [Deltaproteobacteria bacterium]NCP02274.1 UDP-3-O-acyl-N-acetylglucosamine deacetylase [Deltaproteobacteria bacterium]NCP78028.1 UDP-3-O-acyl-N-acetylglucosamine deacetylase [Desulfuromonadales bacterium]